MKSKKILIVTHGFYPERSPRSYRATELAMEFSRQGHLVTVVAPYREGTSEFLEMTGIHFISMGKLNWSIYNFRNFGLIGKLYNRIVNRFLPLILEFPMMELFFLVRRILSREGKKFDLLISIAVPYTLHWGVASLWRMDSENIARKWVADCGDPYFLQQNDTFKPPFYFGWVEKWFMRKVDYIIVPFGGAINSYFSEFHEKIKIIPQGLSFPDITETTNNEQIISFAYAGNVISYSYHAKPFLMYLNTIEVNYKFIIYTKDFEFYRNLLDDRTLLKCEFYEYTDRNQLLRELSKVDFLIHFPYRFGIQRSLKLIDYQFLKKPILSYSADDESNLHFLQFLNKNYANRLTPESIEEYRVENVAKSFLNLI
jgi:hypothetical protein